jgi:hypothetical protein
LGRAQIFLKREDLNHTGAGNDPDQNRGRCLGILMRTKRYLPLLFSLFEKRLLPATPYAQKIMVSEKIGLNCPGGDTCPSPSAWIAGWRKNTIFSQLLAYNHYM